MRAQIAARVQEMLADLGQRVSTAGKEGLTRLDAFDRAYADKVQGLHGNIHETPLQYATSATPISEIINPREFEADGLVANMVGRGIQGTMLGANVASRYALPAGGVTLAGKGLMDIAAGLTPEEEEENLMIRYS